MRSIKQLYQFLFSVHWIAVWNALSDCIVLPHSITINAVMRMLCLITAFIFLGGRASTDTTTS